jgi:type III pantothenate kinase
MILAIDIGNSSIKFGVFENKKLVSRFSVPTVRDQTAEEIFSQIKNASDEIQNFRFSAIVIASVVPELKQAFIELGERFFDLTPVFVDNRFDFGLKIKYYPPDAVGTDRIVAAFAAVEKYGKPAIICDFGTATTIDAVNSKGEYLGGIITPGINTLSEALFLKTSKLPRVELEKPENVIGNSTVSSIQSGIFYGYIGLTEGILKRMTEELGEKPRVVATGGFSRLIAENCPLIEIVDENLMLEGLRMIYERN